MSTLPSPTTQANGCPLCASEFGVVSRWMYMSPGAVQAERVCQRCYLALSPMESIARRSLTLPLGDSAPVRMVR